MVEAARYFRRKAQQCRDLISVDGKQEVVDQLQLWIGEFEEEAFKAEARAAEKARS